MIYLRLFLVFLQIGAFTFGGGYGMIPLIRESVLRYGWLTEGDFISVLAVAESTPGPIAINMATFVGASQGGILGSLAATLGVVLPSFVLILLIAALIRNLLKYKGVQAFLSGVRPCVAALILATALTMGLRTLIGVTTLRGGFFVDPKAIAIFALLLLGGFALKKWRKKSPSPIVMILLSAGLGILFYS
ncbi:MAG: chromate transporter [Oscillospiraceae bacterium]|jgi:chromate transporter|nr:chromate transporter [Oscillospiraceae bacterium]